METSKPIAAVILAGGLARRMDGQVKPLKEISGKTILAHIIERIAPQVDQVILNVNQNQDLFQQYNLPMAKDSVEGFVGPLGGVLAGMEWVAAHMPESRYMLSIPGDGPFIPTNLIEKLFQPIEKAQADLSVAVSNGRTQPVVGIWDVTYRDALRAALVEEKLYKVDLWT